MSDSKSPQFSRTILSILADLNNAVIWMVSTRPLISKCCSPRTSYLVTIPSASNTIGITVTFTFHSFVFVLFFCSFARSRYLSLFRFSSVLPCSQPQRQSPQFSKFFFLFFFLSLAITRFDRLAEIRWLVSIS